MRSMPRKAYIFGGVSVGVSLFDSLEMEVPGEVAVIGFAFVGFPARSVVNFLSGSVEPASFISLSLATSPNSPIFSSSLLEVISWSHPPSLAATKRSFRERFLWPGFLSEVSCRRERVALPVLEV